MTDACHQTTPQVIQDWLDVIARVMLMGIVAVIGAAYAYLIFSAREEQHNG